MGFPKALLLTQSGKPFVAAIVATFAAAGITDIVVDDWPRPRSNRRGARERGCRSLPRIVATLIHHGVSFHPC